MEAGSELEQRGQPAFDGERPGGRPEDSGGELQERRLARPVGADDSDRLASGDLERDVVPRRPVPGEELVDEGVLAVNGVSIDTTSDPWAAFQGFGGKTALLTVNASPSPTGARQVVVNCLSSETELRFRSWIEERRQSVDKATDGKVGYIHLPDTSTAGNRMLQKMFYSQAGKPALIELRIDPDAITPATTLSAIREKALKSKR